MAKIVSNMHPTAERLGANRSLPTNVAERPHVINVNTLRTQGQALSYGADILVGNWVEQRTMEQTTDPAPLSVYSLAKPLLRTGNWNTSYGADFQTAEEINGGTKSFQYTSRYNPPVNRRKEAAAHYQTTNKGYGSYFKEEEDDE